MRIPAHFWPANALHALNFRVRYQRLYLNALLGIILTSTVASAYAQAAPVLVGLSGSAAPAGGNYNSFESPVLNAFGRVAFRSTLSGGPSNQGIFVGTPGSVQAIALQGTAAPAGGNYLSFIEPVLNGAGQVAFRGFLAGGSSTEGVFVGGPGLVQAAALQGAAAPSGGSYMNFNAPTINGSGAVAYRAGTTTGLGVFVGVPGTIQAAAREAAAAPGGGTYGGFNSPTLNGSGQVAFRASVNNTVVTTLSLFVGAPGSIQPLALQNAAAPGGGNYSFFSTSIPELNASGQVAFGSLLAAGSSTRALFVGAPGSVQAASRQGTAAPAGGNYSDFDTPAVNGVGQVSFRAFLTGGSSNEGIFVGAPGSIQAAALQGGAAPDGGDFSFFRNAVLNSFGQVAFVGNLSGVGVNSTNNLGLYAGSVGAITKIVRKGDIVDVDPSAGVNLRTVSDLSLTSFSVGGENRGGSFNDRGDITYGLTFTDNSSGIFISYGDGIFANGFE